MVKKNDKKLLENEEVKDQTEDETESDEVDESSHSEMLAKGWKTLTDKKDKDKKPVKEDHDVESAGAKTLHPNSRPVSDPKSRIERMKSVIGHMASMEDHELTKWWEQAVGLIGHEADKTPDAENRNKDSIGAKPSDAVGTHDGSGTFKMPLVSVKEDLDALFATDETLTEEAKETMTTLFEAAVSARVMLEREELEEQYLEILEETSNEIRAQLEEQLDSYLDYAVTEWMQENEVAIENTLRMELAEEFIDSMKNVFSEHFIDVPDDKVDLVDALTDKVTELEEELNNAIGLVNELRGLETETKLDDVFDEIAADLSDAQKEKFAALSEGIEFNGDIEKFTKKLNVIKESYFPGTIIQETKDDMESDGEILTEEVEINPRVQVFAKALGKK